MAVNKATAASRVMADHHHNNNNNNTTADIMGNADLKDRAATAVHHREDLADTDHQVDMEVLHLQVAQADMAVLHQVDQEVTAPQVIMIIMDTMDITDGKAL